MDERSSRWITAHISQFLYYKMFFKISHLDTANPLNEAATRWPAAVFAGLASSNRPVTGFDAHTPRPSL